jgi:hypothetical protein
MDQFNGGTCRVLWSYSTKANWVSFVKKNEAFENNNFLKFYFLVQKSDGGPSAEELIHELEQCDLSNSHNNTPSASPCITNLQSQARLKSSNVAFLNQTVTHNCGDI